MLFIIWNLSTAALILSNEWAYCTNNPEREFITIIPPSCFKIVFI